MANEKEVYEVDNAVIFFTQRELAQRWRVTEATIKSIRDNGGIPCFYPPNSSRVLYPVEEVIRIEQSSLNLIVKEERKQKKPAVNKRKKSVNPSNSNVEWRI